MAYWLLVLTTLFWSGNFVLARAMHADMPPITMAFWRWLLALLILLPWVLPRLWAERRIIRHSFPILLLLAVLGVANFNTFVYLGVQTTTAVNATLLQSAVPVIILLLARFVLGQAITGYQYLGIAVSLAGVLTIVTQGAPQALLEMTFNGGDLWILGSVFTWAFYSVALKWRPQALSSLGLLGITVLLGVIVLLPFWLWEQQAIRSMNWNSANVAVIGYMAVFPSVLAYLFWNRGVAELGAARAGLFVHLMPAFGLILSMLFLGEQVRAFHILGIALIFGGIFVATFLVGRLPNTQ